VEHVARMASTLTRILLHVTFSTKDRAALIPAAIEPDLHAYVGGICRCMDSTLIEMGGTADHVHMLVGLGKTIALSELMLHVKRESSKWLRRRDASLDAFAWQAGYFAFSIGESGIAPLRAYISNQKEHHTTIDFQDEVRALLRRYRMQWDERYIWS
jgi:REP-associated tyrosine transposase